MIESEANPQSYNNYANAQQTQPLNGNPTRNQHGNGGVRFDNHYYGETAKILAKANLIHDNPEQYGAHIVNIPTGQPATVNVDDFLHYKSNGNNGGRIEIG